MATTGGVAGRLRETSLIETFYSRCPDLPLELLISGRILDLSMGEADLNIRAGEPQDETLIGRKTADAPWAV